MLLNSEEPTAGSGGGGVAQAALEAMDALQGAELAGVEGAEREQRDLLSAAAAFFRWRQAALKASPVGVGRGRGRGPGVEDGLRPALLLLAPPPSGIA